MIKKKTAASLVDSQQCRRNLVYDRIVVAAIFNFFLKKTTQITLRSCLEGFLLLLRQRFFGIAVFMNGILGSTLDLA